MTSTTYRSSSPVLRPFWKWGKPLSDRFEHLSTKFSPFYHHARWNAEDGRNGNWRSLSSCVSTPWSEKEKKYLAEKGRQDKRILFFTFSTTTRVVAAVESAVVGSQSIIAGLSSLENMRLEAQLRNPPRITKKFVQVRQDRVRASWVCNLRTLPHV